METTETTVSRTSVYSNTRAKKKGVGSFLPSNKFLVNARNEADGLTLLAGIQNKTVTAAFLDPQYRGIMDKMKYGNEGQRQKERAVLRQMDEDEIRVFVEEIDRVLIESGHLFLWIDKFHLCEGTSAWTKNTTLSIVDLITWDKGKIGMGYRTRRKTEYLLVLQKQPLKAKGLWTRHDIPDVWTEKIMNKVHPHQKPVELQKMLIDAVSAQQDYILDPCAGSYSVLNACKELNRNFIGSDIKSIETNRID